MNLIIQIANLNTGEDEVNWSFWMKRKSEMKMNVDDILYRNDSIENWKIFWLSKFKLKFSEKYFQCSKN